MSCNDDNTATLKGVKDRVSARFLGQNQIHGIGLHASKPNTISVFRNENADQDIDALIKDLSKEAYPFQVELVHEEAPMLQGGGASILSLDVPIPISDEDVDGEKDR